MDVTCTRVWKRHTMLTRCHKRVDVADRVRQVEALRYAGACERVRPVTTEAMHYTCMCVCTYA